MSDTKTKKEAVVYHEGIGRRKTSVARVRISAGKSEITINEKTLKDYFSTSELQSIIQEPFKKTKTENFKITIKVNGGGIHSQAEAARHGISRALVKINPENRKILKPEGMLTRDQRMKERRKFGLKKARKSPQWSKR